MTTAQDGSSDQVSLWSLVAPPAIWAAHFLASYITAAVWCAKVAGPAGSLGAARTAIFGYTIVALAAVVTLGWRGYRRHRRGGGQIHHHDDDSSLSRYRFLGFATFLLALLSTVAIVYAATAVLFLEDCR